MRSYYIVWMICVLLVAGTASWTLATEWVEYFATKPYFYYYDREDMRPLEYYVNLLGLKISKPGLYRVWLKRLVKDPSGRKMHVDIQEARKLTTQGYDFYSHTIYQKDVNCSERKVRLLSEADYDSEGRLLGRTALDDRYARWANVLPDTDDAALLESVCRSQKAKELKPAEKEGDYQQQPSEQKGPTL